MKPRICRQIMTVRSDGTLSHTAGYQSDSHPKIRLTPPNFFRRK